ncbi:MAG: hypothetical protein DGJ47_000155 [Rickettsiaceae bacterium]
MPKPYFNNSDRIKEIIRVDHAGEYGAMRIYQGQIAASNNQKELEVLQDMLEHEKEHLEYFVNKIEQGESRPTLMMPIWDNLGFALGYISKSISYSTAMLTTEAIEEVIVKHYEEQIDYLEQDNVPKDLCNKIKKFRDDEAEHINIALQNNSRRPIFNSVIKNTVKFFCKTAIFISKKI